jgi:RND superfamily putative drug exporter
MFAWLGRIIARTWPAWLAFWALLWAGTGAVAPRWLEVARDGEFDFLPHDVPGRRGEGLLRRAFPDRFAGSSIVIVVTHEDTSQGLTEDDRRFVAETLRPALERIAA